MTEARDANSLVADLARSLNVDIDEHTLQLCVKLMDLGVDAQKLASAIKSIRRETQAVTSQQ